MNTREQYNIFNISKVHHLFNTTYYIKSRWGETRKYEYVTMNHLTNLSVGVQIGVQIVGSAQVSK